MDNCADIIGVVRTTCELRGTVQIVKEHDTYNGQYNVIPKGNAQTLYTMDKLMKENVVVEKIPYYEVSNDSDGITAIIGGND